MKHALPWIVTALTATTLAAVLAANLVGPPSGSQATTTASAQDDWDVPPNNPGLPLYGHQPDHLHPFAGGLRVHDPGLYAGGDGDDWYVFGTGNPEIGDGNIQIRSSPDGSYWTFTGTVWDTRPGWIDEAVPGVETLWAPEIHHSDGTYYLYYAASTFGSNRSLIGLATNTTLDPDDPAYEWADQGMVLESFEGDSYNAIDPGIATDSEGRHWMTFGSFWSGIHLVELDWPSGKPVQGAEPVHLVDRIEAPNAVEAPFLMAHEGYHYLFVSFDHCCRVDSDYKIAVGRSEDITGPYVDAGGVPMLEGGGTVIVADEGTITGSGGQSVSGGLLAYTYYDTDLGPDFDFRMAIRELHWTDDGWPYVQ
ncbi:arabinan endo-1,5-alpha-L-arabinosidase [Nocardiopsis valliformis]|uniref:arabinan endo-1,5-alpha-L-arabinosidase n=1 Tax=Nocardiopsis valliformis TaxID=239974 RepID=UPI00034580BA|nr:arabinan endo-1,5-alpha-L-arabinosidase [Nocardiopsis valliformis]